MKILSVRHPWAHLIIHGGKDIENRTWQTRYRGSILIHASNKCAPPGAPEISSATRGSLRFGGVIGIVELVDCVSNHASDWFAGPFGFVLRNARAVDFIKWPGALGLREAPTELVQLIGKTTSAQISASTSGACAQPEFQIP